MNTDPTPNKPSYMFGKNVLEFWAKEGTKIRQNFRDKSELYGRTKVGLVPKNNEDVRSRQGFRLSVASRDPLGQKQ